MPDLQRVKVWLWGCDDGAVNDLMVTPEELAFLRRLEKLFGTNEDMSSCAPGIQVLTE